MDIYTDNVGPGSTKTRKIEPQDFSIVILNRSRTMAKTLQEMMAEAAAFRGEISTPDPMVEAARAASHRLAWGVSQEECQAALVEEHGLTAEAAFLATKMGALL